MFKLRGSRLGDAEPGLLGQVAGSESNWVEGVGAYVRGACGSVLGRVVDGFLHFRSLLFNGAQAPFILSLKISRNTGK